jgi:methionine-S-sulfoxide reductase
MKTIVLGGGCFWCIEAIYQRVKGVDMVVSGYAGGDLLEPTYENHGTHAEVVQLTYNEKVINLEILLEIFFYVHDPTTLNRQGNDVGTQYRSIILCNDYFELGIAEKIKKSSQSLWDNTIVTEINQLEKFYPAEEYHQNYFNNNQSAGYCQVVINPKISKFEAKYSDYLIAETI